MEFSRHCLLVALTVLLIVLENQSNASFINNQISKTFPDSKEKLDIGGDKNIVSSIAANAIDELHAFAAKHTKAGPIGEAIDILRDGWEKTIKFDAVALNAALDLFDTILGNDIEDKIAALNAINNGVNDVKTLIYKAGNQIHSSLGAAKSKVNITDKGEFQYAIDTVQECGTGIFDDLETAQFFASQGLKFEFDVKEKHLEAAHSAIKSASEMCPIIMVAGAKKAIEYLSGSDEAKIVLQEPTEKLISDAAKAAAAADSDTVAALAELNNEFDTIIASDISGPILKEVKKGLVEYIDYSAWAVALCYDAIAQAKVLINTDPQAAIRIIENSFKLAKTILIEGSVKTYEGIGSMYNLTGSRESFHDAIEMAERSRVEGTKGFDSAKIVAVRALLTGGKAAEHALNAVHVMLEANEAAIFEDLKNIVNYIIKLIKLKL